MLNGRYDVFGSAELGDATFKGKYVFPFTPGGVLDIPPRRVVPFDRLGSLQKGDWLHFYVHDCRFCKFLEKKDRYLKRMVGVAGFVGIDNSLYCDLPLAEQIHSCYLNRAIDYCLFKTGRPVVANVSWGDWRSYEFCFDGIASECTVAMSSYGCSRSNKEKFRFEDGFVMAVERLRPKSVLLHGSIWPRLAELAEYHKVPLVRIPTQREIAYGKEVRHG